jgi:hemerythrin superfamily protein
MRKSKISLSGAAVGGVAGWAAEVAIQEVTGHHITHGLLELLGAAAGLWRLDRRLAQVLRDTLDRARAEEAEDYQQVKRRIDELTRDLPELREILGDLVDAGIQAQKA